MDRDIQKVTNEFIKYGDFIEKLKKVIDETQRDIDADDPTWR